MTQANRYKELAALTKRADNLDPAYYAAFYLLSHDPELYETARRFVNVDGISFTGMKRAARDFDERTRLERPLHWHPGSGYSSRRLYL